MSRKFLVPITLSNQASDPASANAGDMYYNTASNVIRIFNGSTWSSLSGSAYGYYFQTTAPSSPSVGDKWIDSSTGIEYTYLSDGNSTQWVDFNIGPVGPTGPQGNIGINSVFTRQGSLLPQVGTQRFYVERTGTLTSVRATLGTPSAGSPVVVDVLKNGSSVLSAPIQVAAGNYTATGTISNSSVSAGDYYTVTILGIGSVTAGANLTVTIAVDK